MRLEVREESRGVITPDKSALPFDSHSVLVNQLHFVQ